MTLSLPPQPPSQHQKPSSSAPPRPPDFPRPLDLPRPLNSIFLRMLWLRLFLPLLVSGLVMVAGVGFFGSRSFQSQQISLANSILMSVNNYLTDASRVMEMLSQRYELSNQADLELSMEVVKGGYPYFEAFYYLDKNGRVLAAIPNGEQYRGLDMSQQSYYQKAMLTSDTVITPSFISANTGQPTVYLAHSIAGQGVIAAELNLSELQRMVSAGSGLGGGSQVFITDHAGIVLAHPRKELVAQQAYLGSMRLLQEARSQPTSMYYWDDGTLVVGSAAKLPGIGWVVVSQSPVSKVFSPLLIPTLTFVLLALVAEFTFIRLFSKQFDQVVAAPLGKLGKITSQVASANYAVAEQMETIPQAFQEMSALAYNFSNMTQSVLSREKMLQHMASHDPLTNLPNRELFHKTLVEKIAACGSESSSTHPLFGVLFIDLDDFKSINDAFGHHIGDLALQMVASYLVDNTRSGDCVGRLGGDEFAVLLDSARSVHTAAAMARQIVHAINRPMYIDSHEIYTSCSLGISLYPSDGHDADTLIQNADTAMYKAKHEGKNNYQFYSMAMETQAQERHKLTSHLHHALENQEFTLHYQPLYTARGHHIAGSEALLRWNNAVLGNVYPDRFIPLAVETGLILPVGEWVLRAACTQNQHWVRQGYTQARMNVNIAERQLKQPEFVPMLARVLDESGLPPHLLNLELTENIFFGTQQHIREVNALLMDVKRLGVMLSLDDFGTGKGTLSLLTQIPFDEIKIDRMLSNNVLTDPRNTVIVRGIVQMARGLGKTVVAEGIETIAQVDFFEEIGVDLLQGYFFSRPLTCPQFEQILSGAQGTLGQGPVRG